MNTNKNIFVSYNPKDIYKVQLLKDQAANSKDIDITFLRETPLSSENIRKSIESQISKASLMLVMIGDHLSKWQEYEFYNALKCNIPVVGVLTNYKITVQKSPFYLHGIPVVNWNWNEISNVLNGHAHTIDYKIPEELDSKSQIIQLDFSRICQELTKYIVSNPNIIHRLSPRKFEELVAYIMEKHGYKVTLTQQSKDGGIDIFALKNDGFGNILTIVDCKKYSSSNPIGIAEVRRMYGTLQIENASHGIIATTSRFTSGATKLAQEYKYQISLKDHADILRWIQST